MKHSSSIPKSLNDRLQQLTVARKDDAAAKQGLLRLYFDTSDVQRAILGAREFIHTDRGGEPRVDRAGFERRETLPSCLMAGGFLGKITMLAPHQQELLNHIQTHEKFSRANPIAFSRNQFFTEVGITQKWGSDGRAGPDRSALKTILKKYAGTKTELFYKAVQCTRFQWWEQLKRLRKDGLLVANSDAFDYPALLAGRRLPKIVAAFNKLRPMGQHEHLIPKNNFADAMCLTMLIELVRRFNDGETSVIPRFFDSSAWFHTAAREAGVSPQLELKITGAKSSALVGPEYVMCRASLSASSFPREDTLVQLKEDLQVSPKTSGAELSRLQSAMDRRGMAPLAERFDLLLNYSFLENVWLSTIAEDELAEMAANWTVDLVKTAEFREAIEETIETVSADLLKGAGEYKRLSTTWLALRTEILRWRKRKKGQTSLPPLDNDEHGLDLFRISPPEHVCARARPMLSALDEDGHVDEVVSTTAWAELFSACVAASMPHGSPRKLSQGDFEVALTVLWCTQSYGRVVDLFRSVPSRYKTYFARIVSTASILRIGRQARDVEAMIDQVARESPVRAIAVLSDSEFLVAAEQASSLAYLWFHYWQQRWKLGAWWRCAPADMPAEEHEDYDKWLKNAIVAVTTSWEHVLSRRRLFDDATARAMYVANQRLFYLVELGAAVDLPAMESMQQYLMGYKASHNGYWRQTYADTLARYYAFRAARSSDAGSWAKYMNIADSHFSEAQELQELEPTIQRFGQYLATCREKGFVAPVRRPPKPD